MCWEWISAPGVPGETVRPISLTLLLSQCHPALCKYRILLLSYNVHLTGPLPNSHWKYKLLDKQRLHDYSKIYPFMASKPSKPTESCYSHFNFMCLQNCSQLVAAICCHMSNVVCMYTHVMKVYNSKASSKTMARLFHYTFLLTDQPFKFISSQSVQLPASEYGCVRLPPSPPLPTR